MTNKQVQRQRLEAKRNLGGTTPVGKELSVVLKPRVKNILDRLDAELVSGIQKVQEQITELQHKAEALRAEKIAAMTDAIMSYLEGLDISVDLTTDDLKRSADRDHLEITFRGPAANMPNPLAAPPVPPVAE